MVKQFTYTAIQANETVQGTIIGSDGDESCTVSAFANQPHFLSQSQKDFFTGAAAGLAVPAAGFTFIAEACAASIIGGPVCGLPSALIAAGFGVPAVLAGVLVLDPSDPNFTQIATPLIPSIPSVGATPNVPQSVIDAVNALLQNEAQIVGIEKALITTLNRAEGASDAANALWLNRQLLAATQFEGQLAALFSQEAALLGALQGALTTAGIDVSITAAQVLNFESQVAFGGLPLSVLTALQQFGADASVIQDVRNLTFVQDIHAVAGNLAHLLTPQSLISQLTSLSVGPPSDKDMCKNGIWQYFNSPRRFKNQGDCIQFVNTGK